jgi:hypothetical protein
MFDIGLGHDYEVLVNFKVLVLSRKLLSFFRFRMNVLRLPF